MEQKFYKCSHCGKIVALVKESGVPVMCCGTKMEEIIPGSVDASEEKHVPCFTIEDNTVVVTIGEVEHPMTEEHYIEWVSIQTNRGNQRKFLSPSDKPAICFALCPNERLKLFMLTATFTVFGRLKRKQKSLCVTLSPWTPKQTKTTQSVSVTT